MAVNPYVLIVEDSADDAHLIQRALRIADKTVETLVCESAVEARLHMVKPGVRSPDLILLDHRSPHPNSTLDFVRWARTDNGWTHTPIVVLTSAISETDIELAHDCGVNECITKPCEFAILVSTMSDLLGKTRGPWPARGSGQAAVVKL